MRLTFVKTLTRLAEENPRLVLLTGDLGFQIFDEFRSRFGSRYINAGVAEAQMICAAAGLAFEGWRPFTYSIASFHIGRPYEQIRLSIGYPGLPVVIVGVGGGFGYSHSGITHHGAYDLALMGSIPGMTIIAPGDPNEVDALLPQIVKLSGPSYLRIGRGGEPLVQAASPIILGKARLLSNGEGIAILSTGEMASVAMKSVEILKSEGICPIVYQFHTLKPFDSTVLDIVASQAHTIITIEEHLPDGGLNSAVNAWRASLEKGPRLIRLGPPDELALGNLHTGDLRCRLKYDAESLAERCRGAWKKLERSNR